MTVDHVYWRLTNDNAVIPVPAMFLRFYSSIKCPHVAVSVVLKIDVM